MATLPDECASACDGLAWSSILVLGSVDRGQIALLKAGNVSSGDRDFGFPPVLKIWPTRRPYNPAEGLFRECQ